MFPRLTSLLLAIAAFASADILTLRSGEVVRGDYLGGDARHVKMAVGDRVESYSVDEVSGLQFSGAQSFNNEDRDRDRDRDRRPPDQTPAIASQFQIPSGTPITVRMIELVDSEQSRIGETFRASVDDPVVLDGQVVIPRGAEAVTRLVEDRQSGKFEGKTVLTLTLIQVMANDRMLDLTTGDVTEASSSRGSRTAKVVGGTAAVGAIIGAIAGGGRGAAIGAGSGAAVGTGVESVTKGQRVRIPSETRLTFTLQRSAQL